MPRLDHGADLTGLTCGSPTCIAEVARLFEEKDALADAFAEFVRNLAFKTDTSGDIHDYVKEVLEEIEQDYDDWEESERQVIEEIAPVLGIAVKEGDEERDLDAILADVATEVINLKSMVERVEAQTGGQ